MRIPKVTDFRHLEEVVNKVLGLSSTKGSGNVGGDGDGKGREKDLTETYSQILSECKYTESIPGTVAIKKKEFQKIENAAIRLGRRAVMFRADGDGDVYCVLKLGDFEDIYRGHIENEKRAKGKE